MTDSAPTTPPAPPTSTHSAAALLADPEARELIADSEALMRYARDRRNLVDEALKAAFPPPERWPKQLHAACSWALFGGGKRMRPVLALAAFEAVGGSADLPYDAVLPAACAVEMVHSYSLVHDDLPCMDDDDMRRGRPTVHKQFGEALALLAGDALLTEAFAVVMDRKAYRGTADADLIVDVSRDLGRAAGWLGMVGGQAIDLGFEGAVDDEAALQFLHRRKTGELFRFACRAGALLGRASEDQVAALSAYGEALGLAFQIADDVLDALQDQSERGEVGSDGEETPSFPAMLGFEASRDRAQELMEHALDCLESFDERALPLRRLAWYAVHRQV